MVESFALKDFFVGCLNLFFLVQTSLDNTTLHDAIRSDNLYKVKFFLKQGCDVNAKNDFEGTPLHSASARGYLDMVKLLIQNGARPNEKNGCGSTPLHWAAMRNFPDVAAFLIDKGAKINEVNKSLKTPARIAVKFDNADVFEVLVKHGADMNEEDERGFGLFYSAADEGSANIIKFFIKKGFDVNAKNKFGKTPLFYSIRMGSYNRETIQCLLENGAMVDDDTMSFCSYSSTIRKELRVIREFDNAEDKLAYVMQYAEQDSVFFSEWFKKIVFCRSAIDIFKKKKKMDETTYYKFFMHENKDLNKDYDSFVLDLKKNFVLDLKKNIKQANLVCISQADVSRVLWPHFHQKLFETRQRKNTDVIVFCEH